MSWYLRSHAGLPGVPAQGEPVSPALSESDHLDWLALLRVRSGRVSKHGDRYAYRGQPFPAVSLVAAALRRLEQAGLLALAEPVEHGLAAVALTEAGLARHRVLTRQARPLKPGRPPVEPSAPLRACPACLSIPDQRAKGRR